MHVEQITATMAGHLGTTRGREWHRRVLDRMNVFAKIDVAAHVRGSTGGVQPAVELAKKMLGLVRAGVSALEKLVVDMAYLEYIRWHPQTLIAVCVEELARSCP